MKKIIMLSIITATACCNTTFGMFLRQCKRLAPIAQKRYHGGAEINNQQILERLEQERRLLEIIHDDLKKIHLTINALQKTQMDDDNKPHVIELPEGNHPLTSTARTGGALY